MYPSSLVKSPKSLSPNPQSKSPPRPPSRSRIETLKDCPGARTRIKVPFPICRPKPKPKLNHYKTAPESEPEVKFELLLPLVGRTQVRARTRTPTTWKFFHRNLLEFTVGIWGTPAFFLRHFQTHFQLAKHIPPARLRRQSDWNCQGGLESLRRGCQDLPRVPGGEGRMYG